MASAAEPRPRKRRRGESGCEGKAPEKGTLRKATAEQLLRETTAEAAAETEALATAVGELCRAFLSRGASRTCAAVGLGDALGRCLGQSDLDALFTAARRGASSVAAVSSQPVSPAIDGRESSALQANMPPVSAPLLPAPTLRAPPAPAAVAPSRAAEVESDGEEEVSVSQAVAVAKAKAKAAIVKSPAPKRAITKAPGAAAAAKAAAAVAATAPPASAAAAPAAPAAPASAAAAKPELEAAAAAAEAPPAAAKPLPPATSSRSSSSREEELFNLVKELTTGNGVVKEDGELNKKRLKQVFRQLLQGSPLASAEWSQVWNALAIPEEQRSNVARALMARGWCDEGLAEVAPDVLGELVRTHKVRLGTLEAALQAEGSAGRFAESGVARSVLVRSVVNLFPRPGTCSYGWSRVGWSWTAWWAFLGRILQALDGQAAVDVLAEVLASLQAREGKPLAQQDAWSEPQRRSAIKAKAKELSGLSSKKLRARLAAQGVELGDDLASGEAVGTAA
eukprot:TRINITY_DN29626_c0_g2_i1.p1 TRINITY_DN29626_c0_g2~~TRINITY_DN29626_c0_g2_i1.p1  ORF type:complete len:509 (-),score=144.12 TRINITY_DN29626_c0_g2_i1:70-1596(-)